MKQIIECVPNFSEGRRPEVYNAIADAIRAVPGTHVLDVSADADHNRSVITFVGTPAAIEQGAFQAIAKAAQLINLDEHEGEHPRIGATDVCPFIPVKGVTVDDCVALAKRLGQRVGEELGIAVYLYGEASSRPDRKKLSTIRRGEYEKWREDVETHPDRQPDFGPAEPSSWGATVIGVRPFLIAYNLYLNTSDVELANKIARAVRFSNGGLRFVQALGFLVDGQAQVSMNLTDFTKTPVHRVQELVRLEAARYGLSITKAELVGLIPEQTLLNSAKWYLQLDDLRDEQILELQLAKEEAADFTPHAFIEATAAGTPTPGGGSSAALAGALAAALTGMVSELTVGRKKYVEVDADARKVQRNAASLRQRLTAAILEDSAAFDDLMATWKDKKLSGDEKVQAIEKATIHAGEVPLKVARLSREAAVLANEITRIGNANAVTDAAAAAILAKAAIQIAALNVRINALSLKDQAIAQSWLQELIDLEADANRLADESVAEATSRGGF